MSEKKEKQEEVITERTSEQACKEVEAICALLNARTTEFKLVQQGVGKNAKMVPNGAWEYSPLTENESMYLKTAAISLINRFVERGELVKFKKPEILDAPKEVSTSPTSESKMEVVKEETNKVE